MKYESLISNRYSLKLFHDRVIFGQVKLRM